MLVDCHIEVDEDFKLLERDTGKCNGRTFSTVDKPWVRVGRDELIQG
eukprot:COSAG01_NODE_37228_length_506_cov_2.061425_1_plen_47_part_00